MRPAVQDDVRIPAGKATHEPKSDAGIIVDLHGTGNGTIAATAYLDAG
jgi:hypothetical protein